MCECVYVCVCVCVYNNHNTFILMPLLSESQRVRTYAEHNV